MEGVVIKDTIFDTAEFVKRQMEGEGSGHDWWHVYRVWMNAKVIGKDEDADMVVVELAALLHDIADHKFHDGDHTVGPKKAGEWLKSIGVNAETVTKVQEVIEEVSFRGAGEIHKVSSIEAAIVQDADRLDALGAIGIARCFAFGGYKQRQIFDPKVAPEKHQSRLDYNNSQGTSINHFYEKLFLLKDLMNTSAGKKLAEERHQYMVEYVKRFKEEWEGKR